MDKCVNHPETETPFECLKYNVCLCVECLSCRDPEIYCKFRTSCPIAFIEKHSMSWGDESEKKRASAL